MMFEKWKIGLGAITLIGARKIITNGWFSYFNIKNLTKVSNLLYVYVIIFQM